MAFVLFASNAIRLLCIEWFTKRRFFLCSLQTCFLYSLAIIIPCIYSQYLPIVGVSSPLTRSLSKTFDFNLCVIFERNNDIGDGNSDKNLFIMHLRKKFCESDMLSAYESLHWNILSTDTKPNMYRKRSISNLFQSVWKFSELLIAIRKSYAFVYFLLR